MCKNTKVTKAFTQKQHVDAALPGRSSLCSGFAQEPLVTAADSPLWALKEELVVWGGLGFCFNSLGLLRVPFL